MGKLKLFFTCLLMASISFVNAQTKTASNGNFRRRRTAGYRSERSGKRTDLYRDYY